jgi:uncharacterized protein
LIAYVESSALARLALRQTGYEQLRRNLKHMEQQVSHVLGYVELRSAAARMIKRDCMTDPHRAELLRSAEEVWAATIAQTFDDAQIRRAAGLCELYQLRAYDALHLAAAEALMRIVSSKHMRWFGFDEMQNKAAVAIGLRDGMVDPS